jgi:hypothetical protein
VSTGLIVAAVVAFVLVDVAIMFVVFRSRHRADDYATISVPGETTVTAQAGKLKLSYQESYVASSTNDSIDFGVPGGLELSVVSPTGEPMEITGPGFRGMGSSLGTGRGWSRALIGTVEIVQPGVYTITARGELPDAVDPQILIGK